MKRRNLDELLAIRNRLHADGWRAVPGTLGRFMAHPTGHFRDIVRSPQTNVRLYTYGTKTPVVNIRYPEQPTVRAAAYVIAETFLPPPPDNTDRRTYLRHLDNIQTNISAANLYWFTLPPPPPQFEPPPDPTPEEWRTLPSFPTTEVSNHARVRRASDHRLIKTRTNERGYKRFDIPRPDRGVRGNAKYLHWAVASAWLPKPEGPKLEPAHINGNKLDNRPTNLAWKTREENAADMVDLGEKRYNPSKANPHCRQTVTRPSPYDPTIFDPYWATLPLQGKYLTPQNHSRKRKAAGRTGLVAEPAQDIDPVRTHGSATTPVPPAAGCKLATLSCSFDQLADSLKKSTFTISRFNDLTI